MDFEEDKNEVAFSEDDIVDLDSYWDELNGIEHEDKPEEEIEETEEEVEEEEDDTQSETEETDSEEEEAAEEAEAEETTDTSETEEDFELMHPTLGGKYNRKDTIALAQKGLDYDHIRGDRDNLRKENAELNVYKNFVEDIVKHTGAKDAAEQMLRTRATWKIAEESDKGNDLSEADAILAVQEEMKSSKTNKSNSSPNKLEPEENVDKNRDMVDAFIKEFPDVEAKDVPQSVWDECGKTGDLVGAYRNYQSSTLKAENEKLKSQIEKLKLQKKNTERSAGTRKSAGKKGDYDELVEFWRSL